MFEPPKRLRPHPTPMHSSSYAALCETVALIKMPPASVQSEVTNISIDSCLKQETRTQNKKKIISIDVGGEGRRGRN